MLQKMLQAAYHWRRSRSGCLAVACLGEPVGPRLIRLAAAELVGLANPSRAPAVLFLEPGAGQLISQLPCTVYLLLSAYLLLSVYFLLSVHPAVSAVMIASLVHHWYIAAHTLILRVQWHYFGIVRGAPFQ